MSFLQRTRYNLRYPEATLKAYPRNIGLPAHLQYVGKCGNSIPAEGAHIEV